MRLALLCFLLVSSALAAVPPDLAAALKTFRADGPAGWSFTQRSAGAGESRLERFDASRPAFERWTLLEQDGHAPSPDALRDYREKQSRRSSAGTAPLLSDQLDLETATVLSDDATTTRYGCRMKSTESDDRTARYLTVTLTLHKPTGTLERVELAATEPFSPALGVKIAEMKTVMSYTLATDGAPSHLRELTTRLRGRAFWVKSLDADLLVTRTDFVRATKAR